MTRRFLAAVLWGSFALAACGSNHESGPGGGVVGGSCAHNSDCPYHCITNGYPGGMCTVECSRDEDCPSGTVCVDDGGGICAVLCNAAGDCSSYGSGWGCRDRSRKGNPGSIAVCHGT
jgi:hypothetical protein